MDSWVNPALTAAIVSALVTGAGWFVSIWQNRNGDKIRRAEKVRDVTIAIAAEITYNIDKGNIARQSVKRYLEERYEITLAGQHKAPIADSNGKTKINNPDEDQSF